MGMHMKRPTIHGCIRGNISWNSSFILQVIYKLGFCLQYNMKKLVWRMQIKATASKTKSIPHTTVKFSEACFLEIKQGVLSYYDVCGSSLLTNLVTT